VETPGCRDWIRSGLPIFAAQSGKIFRLHFNASDSEVLVDHRFRSVDFLLSADARYIAYMGSTGERSAAYVYDTANGDDHPLPIADAALFKPEFSPDGRMLAWADVSPRTERQSIAIMNLADHSIRTVAYPCRVQTLHDYQGTELHWSMDGRQLLIGSIAYPKGAYYQIRFPSLAISAIDGRMEPYRGSRTGADSGIHFVVDDHELAYYPQPCPQSRCENQGQPAPGESAQLDRNHRLTVTTPKGIEEVVARGGCEQCGDARIKVLSWLGDGRYLVYQLKGSTYVYEIAENKAGKLFDPGWKFAWYDATNQPRRTK
jgi:hypothetical protein